VSGSWFDGAGNGNAVDVFEVMDSAATKLLLDCVEAGALMSLATTRDGGALGVTVTVDGQWRREYFRDPAALCEWLTGAQDAIAAETSRGRPPAEAGKRRRRS
jgi:hypothetical protein